MKKRLATAVLISILAAGAASANVLTFRMSYFVPHLKGDFWNIEFEQMSFKRANFQDMAFGLQYEAFISRGFSLALAVDIFRKNKGGYYKNWVGAIVGNDSFAMPVEWYDYSDFDPNHSITLSSLPIQASLKWTPFGRRGNIIPYIGGGANMTLWNTRMQGAVIGFDETYEANLTDNDGVVHAIIIHPIYDVNVRESDSVGRVSFGWQAFGGVMIPVSPRMTIDIGGHYFSCPAEFTNSFEGFQPIDVGGYQFSLGLNYWF